MTTPFCMTCGQPLVPGAQFCASCGSPVAGAPPTTVAAPPGPSFSPPSAPAGFAPPPGGPPLSSVLGVQTGTHFLLQHLLVGPRNSYRVMDAEKRHLFTVGENVREEMAAAWSNFTRPAQPGEPRFQVVWGGASHPRMSYWWIEDNSGNIRGTLTLEVNPPRAVCTLADAGGTSVFVVNVTRGPFSISASASLPDGRPMLQSEAHFIHHNFAVQNTSGLEVAKIHEAWASMRDTYTLDLVGNVDPLYAMVFAILINHYKGK